MRHSFRVTTALSAAVGLEIAGAQFARYRWTGCHFLDNFSWVYCPQNLQNVHWDKFIEKFEKMEIIGGICIIIGIKREKLTWTRGLLAGLFCILCIGGFGGGNALVFSL